MQTIDEAVAPEDKISSQSTSAGGCASVDLKQGEAGEAGDVEVAVSAPKRKRAPTATPRKKKVVIPAPAGGSPLVEPGTPRHSVNIEDPLFFPALNMVHRKMQQDARRSKLSSLPIV